MSRYVAELTPTGRYVPEPFVSADGGRVELAVMVPTLVPAHLTAAIANALLADGRVAGAPEMHDYPDTAVERDLGRTVRDLLHRLPGRVDCRGVERLLPVFAVRWVPALNFPKVAHNSRYDVELGGTRLGCLVRAPSGIWRLLVDNPLLSSLEHRTWTSIEAARLTIRQLLTQG